LQPRGFFNPGFGTGTGGGVGTGGGTTGGGTGGGTTGGMSALPVGAGTVGAPFGVNGFGGDRGVTPAFSTTDLTNGGGSFFNPLGAGALFGGAGLGSLFGGGNSFNPYFSMYSNNQETKAERSTTITNSLANGIGDEGRLKAEMARALAAQASPEYSDWVGKRLQNARAALDGNKNGKRQVSILLKDGEKKRGQLVKQNDDWIVIRTDDEEISVRMSEVARITRPLTNGERTASRR